MSRTTKSIESEAKIFAQYSVFDLFFVMVYMLISYMLIRSVYTPLRPLYFIFSFLCSVFLCSKSSSNPGRRNFESIYFMLSNEPLSFRPYYEKGEGNAEDK